MNRARWKDWFHAQFDVRRYDLTRTYFESAPPFPEGDKRHFGDRRDQRRDGVQVVLARSVTPEGLPRADEGMPGNPSDKTPRPAFLAPIEKQYGQAQRLWVMDRGLPTAAPLPAMRQSEPPVNGASAAAAKTLS